MLALPGFCTPVTVGRVPAAPPASLRVTPAVRRSRCAAAARGLRMQVSGGGGGGGDWASAAGVGGSGSGGGSGGGQMEEIEFIIYSDGRVEQTVRGVKGRACTELTEAVNRKLGVVTYTEDTAEAYEQPVTVVNEATQGLDSQGGGMPSW
ncbi:hypothetical protein MMPV_005008 [Pyropia vietnamensis]